MRTAKFLVALVPAMAAVNAAFFAAVWALPLDHSVPSATHVAKAAVFSLALVVVLQVAAMLKYLFKVPDSSVFASHIQPCLAELVKIGFICFIAYHDKGPARLAVVQFVIIGGVPALVLAGRFLGDFTPACYARKYSVFVGLYEDFHRKEYYEDEAMNDATVQVFDSLRRHSHVDTLADKLPKKISVAQLALPDKSLKPQASAPMMRTMSSVSSLTCTSKTLGKYKSCYNMLDKLYSVSPKNTYHLNMATASAVALMDADLEDDIDDEDDAVSVHSSDTHFGTGGGGYFKHKYPGGKLQFGGGGGFDYDHSDGKRPSSGSSAAVDATATNRWWLISWLIPMIKKQRPQGVKHKLSVYNIKHTATCSSESSPLLPASSIDPEANNWVPLRLTKQEFYNYITIYLGLDRFTIAIDPLYEKYGKETIPELTFIETFMTYLADLVWELGTMLVYCLNYLIPTNAFVHYFWVLLVVKLFNVNVLDKLNVRLWVIVGAKFAIDAIIICMLVVLYLT